MKKIINFPLILGVLVLIISSILYYINLNKKELLFYTMKTESLKDKIDNKNEEYKEIIKGYEGFLVFFQGTPHSKMIASAFLCSSKTDNIEKIDLYMPEMGHGSQPPTVLRNPTIPDSIKKVLQKSQNKEDIGCLSISNMQFFMPGHWQVRAFYKEGFIGLFDVEIEQ